MKSPPTNEHDVDLAAIEADRSALRDRASHLGFHTFCAAIALALLATAVEILVAGPPDITNQRRATAVSFYAVFIAAIYGIYLASALAGAGERTLADIRALLLTVFSGLAIFIGFFNLGWNTHAAVSAVFASVLICITHSARWANLSLLLFFVLGLSGFAANADRPPLSDLASYPLSASWSVFTAVLLPFIIAGIINVILERTFKAHDDALLEAKRIAGALGVLANTDPLTGFFNRNKLGETFLSVIEGLAPDDSAVLALLDLDNFKAVNTSSGHAAGDKVLSNIADTIRKALPGASLIRLGGDEFLAIFTVSDEEDSEYDALDNLAQGVSTFFQSERIKISLSIGYTVLSDAATDLTNAVAQADLAMRQAKREGKGQAVRYRPGESVPAAVGGNAGVTAFNPALTGSGIKQEIPARNVGSAILADEIDFEFQPLYDTQTGNVVSVEALLRWRLPDGSLVPLKHYLGTFVALEWQSPFIEHLSKKRLGLIKEIRAAKEVDVHFNLALESILDHQRTERTDRLVNTAEGGNQGMVIEISEKRFNRGIGAESTRSHIMPYRERAAEMGVKLALDDFGKGESNYERLITYPVQIVKLDRSICLRVLSSQKARSVIQHTCGICDDNNIALIAEGIETADQADALKTLGVHIHQGFHYAEAMSKSELLALLHQQAA